MPSPGRPELARFAVLIPAWRPDAALVPLVASVFYGGFGRVLIVDDGSGPNFAGVLEAAQAGGAEVLHLARNRGKGRALKTGLIHLLESDPKPVGVVTADADGQHLPQDILRVGCRLAETIAEGAPAAVLGTRALQAAVPLRSSIGNTLTRHLFARITGQHLQDTQSGLRGLPSDLLPELLTLPGERYEYEMAVLAHLCRAGRRPIEVPIETVYLNGNVGSHFRPLRDTLRVGCALLRSDRRPT